MLLDMVDDVIAGRLNWPGPQLSVVPRVGCCARQARPRTTELNLPPAIVDRCGAARELQIVPDAGDRSVPTGAIVEGDRIVDDTRSRTAVLFYMARLLDHCFPAPLASTLDTQKHSILRFTLNLP